MRRYSQNEINEVAELLNRDGVISIPTDTVYGVCARINSQKAFENLVNAKHRPANKSFPVLCLNEEQIKSIAIVNSNAEKLIHAFMPGPITIVLKKKKEAFEYINNAGKRTSDELAVRILPLKFIKELIQKVGSPLFLSSANLSGQEVCKTLDEIEEVFPNIDGIVEGDVSFGQASTIVDCTSDEIVIQREGPISKERIMEVLKN